MAASDEQPTFHGLTAFPTLHFGRPLRTSDSQKICRLLSSIGDGEQLLQGTGTMLQVMSEGRLLGFDLGDWSMLLGGFAFCGVLALLA